MRSGIDTLATRHAQIPASTQATVVACLALFMTRVYTTMITYVVHKNNLQINDGSDDDDDDDATSVHDALDSDPTCAEAAMAYETVHGIGPTIMKLIVCALNSLGSGTPLRAFTYAEQISSSCCTAFEEVYPSALQYVNELEASRPAKTNDEVARLLAKFVAVCVEARMEEAAAAEADDDTSDSSDDASDVCDSDDVCDPDDDADDADDADADDDDTDDDDGCPPIVYDADAGHCVCEMCANVRSAHATATENDMQTSQFVNAMVSQAFEHAASAQLE